MLKNPFKNINNFCVNKNKDKAALQPLLACHHTNIDYCSVTSLIKRGSLWEVNENSILFNKGEGFKF